MGTSVRSLILVLFLGWASLALFAQGAKMQSPYDAVTEPDADHPVQRDLWFYRGRILPGESAAALRYRAHLQKMQMRAARRAAAQNARPLAGSGNGWTSLGPAPLASNATGALDQQDYGWVSGRATAVAIDPADTSGATVYAGGAYGGMWRSQNATNGGYGNAGGVVWTPLIDNQATLAVGAIAIQPGNATGQLSNVILVGTGEANSSGDSYYGLGILRSADGGSTWNLISTASPGLSFAGLAAARMAFSTKSGQTGTVVAAMATSSVGSVDGLINSVTQRGLYTSTDAGQTWTFHQLTDPGGGLVSPATSATSVTYNASAGMFFAAVRYHGFYSSPDGITWTRLASQPGGAVLGTIVCPANYLSVSTPCPIYRGEIAVVPGRNEMYVWYVDNTDSDKGIWRSTNGGISWTQIPDAGISACGDLSGCGTSQGTYNLEIAAVPNGAASTDLYAGAINLYKCTLNSNTSTTCSQGSWLNLTHVYGCSSIAKVHPDQHDLDFDVVNGKTILYFANDGGVYRALDGYLGLATGSCAGTNQFDSLNQTLGSMTQFVSFSQHPSDPNTILGGTQDNGSPATASATTSSSWLNVNAGDGGYNAVNPANPVEWFTANTDVTIQRCVSGINCLAQNFPYVAQSADLGGDHGAFYTPYLLDPQVTASELIVGTCRVWRGPGAGGSFTALSGDFEPNAVPPCNGNEVNLVRSIAVGGPRDSNGFSNVIYAGTDGFGSGTNPLGGHVWVTTNAAGGAATWADRTANINPGSFPVSGIALDGADPNGQAAYVTIMGFHVSHVWKTTNAGVSWTDFTGTGLPDSPANAVTVDAGTTISNGIVYVATDVGVFSSSTGSPVWTEVGPAPNSGATGFLPNVSVTALHIFSSGGSKRLRASTYGRGVWDFNLIVTPDFQFSFANTTQTIFPTQTAIYSGTLTALNSYNSSVALSCTGTKPSTCSVAPPSVVPTPSGTAFSLTATGNAGDYSFNAHGVGSDTNATTHDVPLILHVVDFGLTAPSPSSVTVNRPSTSQPIAFSVTAAGSFSGTVALSCNGLPSGATCNFSPSASVTPTASVPVAITLTISTLNSTPTGTSSVIIAANTSGAPSAKTQPLSLTVTALPDYSMSVSASESTTVNQALQFTGALVAVNGYNNPVNLSCGAGAPSICTISPSSVTPTAAGASFTVTANSATAGTFSFNIAGAGTDSLHTAHSAPTTLTVNPDFTIGNTSGTQSVIAGQTATYSLNLSPVGSTTFGNTVTYSCSGLPALASCTFNPTSISGSSGTTVVTLSITTVGPGNAEKRFVGLRKQLLLPFAFVAAGLLLAGVRPTTRRKRGLMSTALITTLGLIMIACGGGSGSTTPPPPPVISVQISPRSVTLFTGQTQQFSATVTGTANPGVNWLVNGVVGGSATSGTINASGLYTTPATAPGSGVTVSAVSQADTTKSSAAAVTIQSPTASGTYPITVTAMLNGVQHYTILTLNVQ